MLRKTFVVLPKDHHHPYLHWGAFSLAISLVHWEKGEKMKKNENLKVGQKIRLLKMRGSYPYPIKENTLGVITGINRDGDDFEAEVDWENGRSLALNQEDDFEIIISA
jgi:hypothetical protein